MNFTLPMIPNLDGTERKWEIPSDENMISMVNKERDRILPRGFVLSSSHLSDSNDTNELVIESNDANALVIDKEPV